MKRILLLLILLPLALPLAACDKSGSSSIPNPVATAQTVDQKAYALAGLFQIVKQEAVELTRDKSTPNSAVYAIAEGDKYASPLVRTMMIAAREYSRAADAADAAKASGASNTAALVAALATATGNLASAYERAKPAVDQFVAAVKSGRR